MQAQTDFQQVECELLPMKFGSLTEWKILRFWREYEPNKVEALLSQQALRKTLTLTANALMDMQTALMEYDRLDPTLAAMEAWRTLMRIEEDEDEADKEADWGPWKEDYIRLLERQG